MVGYEGLGLLATERFLTKPCDILIPAAKENQLLGVFANDIKTKVVLELANGPTTNLADQVMFDKEIYLIPDILANAGGVTVSYFEWLQNKAGVSWELDEVNKRLQKRMVNSYKNVVETVQDFEVNMREAAFILAISKAAQIIFDRGIFP